MHPVDTLLIDFNPQQMVILNVAMAFLMFSVALDVRLGDFRKVVDFPRSVGTGLVAQYLAFPLLTLAIIAAFQPPVSVAMGMVLVSMCPSGNMTNFLVHFARANVGAIGDVKRGHHPVRHHHYACRLSVLVAVHPRIGRTAQVLRTGFW